MCELFENKCVSPMLIKEQKEPFDSENYIFEIKFDGIRCIAYLDETTDLRNKKNINITPYYPELQDIHKQVNERCILDGELVVLINGKPDFYKVQRRIVMRDPFKIQLFSEKYPVSFVVYDILCYKDKDLLNFPLMERKRLLKSIVKENDRIIVSRYIETYGKQFFELVKEQNLEGIIAKEITGRYLMGRRTDSWVKCKVYDSIDAVVCGFSISNNRANIIIGQYKDGDLVFKGFVNLGSGMKKLNKYGYKIIDSSPFGCIPRGCEGAVWIKPDIVCIIDYMPSDKETMRLPVFKEIRDDKSPVECQINDVNTFE